MADTEKNGILECIRIAILPLTSDGDFQLATVKFESEFDTIIVDLCSEKLDITFIARLGFRQKISDGLKIDCAFFDKGSKKLFWTKYLSPVLNTNLTNLDEECMQQVLNTYENEGFFGEKIPLEKKEFLESLQLLCKKVNEHLPKIYSLFTSENIDETIRVYSREFRKEIEDGNIF